MNARSVSSKHARRIGARLALTLVVLSSSSLWGQSGSPANHRVDPYLVGCNTFQGCSNASVPLATIRPLCSDEDGCTVRLTWVTLGFTGVAGMVLFGIADNGEDWSYTRDSTNYVFGNNGDGNIETVLSVAFGLSGSCSFVDDTSFRPNAGTFELRSVPDAFGDVTCYVRIDD